MKRFHYAMVAAGFVWLSAVLWFVISNTVGREIRAIGITAEFLDKLPPAVSTPIFILLWFVFLLGWILLFIFGVKPLLRRNSKHHAL